MLEGDQAHYLINVMRCETGDRISLFNGRDGQWQAEVTSVSKKTINLSAIEQTRPQSPSPDLWLVFAAIKGKSELVVEKATELGVSKIIPLVTRHCVVRSLNMEKLEAHAIEAAEQCERLDVPTLETHKDLSHLLGAWDGNRKLLYGDESGGGMSLTKVLSSLREAALKLKAEAGDAAIHLDKNWIASASPRNDEALKVAVLVGPEGGFAADEFAMLRACDFAIPFGMGPRILRADTAAVSALACIQSHMGDWDEQPHFIGNKN